MHSSPLQQDLVLVGGGHAHVHVLKSFGTRPEPGTRVTLVTRDTETAYSGMLPGHIAGLYEHDEAHIDLRRLARATRARLIHAEAVGLDPAAQELHLRGRPPLRYDIISLDTGSSPRLDTPGAAQYALPVKPVGAFLSAFAAIIAQVERTGAVPRLAVVGGGAGGVEVTLALEARLRRALDNWSPRPGALPLTLLTRGDLLPTFGARARRLLSAELHRRGIAVLTEAEVVRVEPGRVETADGRRVMADHVLWVTWAGAPDWLRSTGLALDETGFVAVDASLRSLSHDGVFAAGDVAAVIPHPREKAGVYAVRQGPPLAANLRRALRGQPLKPFRPQATALALVGTGDGRAVAARGALAVQGAWVWRLKEWIDRRWIARYRDVEPMSQPAAASLTADLMRCGGCGAKVPSSILAQALRRLGTSQPEDLDDAALARPPAGALLLQTVDHFRSFLDDPYLFGQIAAQHALGDIYAMGGRPWTALAIAGVPPARGRIMEADLFQMLAGGLAAVQADGARVVGGHSAESTEMSLGFAVTGLAGPERLLRKGGLRPGDRLILTKPLGTGAILAADMRARAKARWVDAALASMRGSSAAASRCLLAHGASACTDVTGFGLAGHLLEMLEASRVDAVIDPAGLPVLDGALALIEAGTLSTLHPDNARFGDRVEGDLSRPRGQILFDPQTAGGLLAGVPSEQAESCLEALGRTGAAACVIGTVTQAAAGDPRIRLLPEQGTL